MSYLYFLFVDDWNAFIMAVGFPFLSKAPISYPFHS